MEYIKPEKVGISSDNILKMIKKLNDSGLNMHDTIIARHGKICYEAYWKPFHKDFPHRIYSATKSFVGIAVGFLIQDGKVNLDDRILKFFPEEEKVLADENLRNQTIRQMLMMTTARCSYDEVWFNTKPDDRVKAYFETSLSKTKIPGTTFFYDSDGSFILGAMVERVSGQSLLEFLGKRVFDKIGMSHNIECLQCPGGHAWGDSALIMPAYDFLKFANFVMNKGLYNGEQFLNSEYVEEATKKQIDNNIVFGESYNTQGYGYQFWKSYDNSFAFSGMGCQFAICVPDKDLIFVCNADNQGIDYAAKLIFDAFFELISREAVNEALPENLKAEEALEQYSNSLTLSVAKGAASSAFAKEIDGKTFEFGDNPMGITKVTLHIDENGGSFNYINEQGEKVLRFAMCKNVFQKFPQYGYSGKIGTVPEEGVMYNSAVSAAWIEERKLYIKVQIIDKYLGNLHIVLSFSNENKACLFMSKNAEDFLNEYNGYACEVDTIYN